LVMVGTKVISRKADALQAARSAAATVDDA
jgi:hypothetical protein